jgi:hypothetical protein
VDILSGQELSADQKNFVRESSYAVKEKQAGAAQSKEQKTEAIGRSESWQVSSIGG